MTRRSLFATLAAAFALPWVAKARPIQQRVSSKEWRQPLTLRRPGKTYRYYWHHCPGLPRYNHREFWILYLEDYKGDLWVPPVNCVPKEDSIRYELPKHPTSIYIPDGAMPEWNRLFTGYLPPLAEAGVAPR
jgi:hypothetical protein